jgi:hypothetical protein
MGTTYSPSIVTNGLIMYYDMNNTQKSWRGAPVTNLLPNPTINSVPTTGNGWGTYNTNQYGSGAYFSIGTVSSISSNIVTMTAAHSLRSYDVMQPQSSGGGVTGGTNYLIKKLSATTFSLHPYNSSQDGSQGYINPVTGTHKVYDDFANDVRISINSSGFPTQWWGYPHLPNSGLVKEVRTNGCSIPGIPTTDCLRLYHTRPDNVTDGMAYNVDANVTASVAHTVSFWTKTVNAAAVGQYISYQIYNYGVTTPTGYSFNAVFGPVGVWTKHSMTFTPNNPYAISYFFPSSGNIIYDLAHIQFESGSTANAWTNSSRSTTQALSDLTGRNTFTVNSLTYSGDNNNSFSFNGSSNNISIGSFSGYSTNLTCEAWFKTTSGATWKNIVCGPTNDVIFTVNSGLLNFGCQGSSPIPHANYSTTTVNTGAWFHGVATYNGNTVRIYINGNLESTNARTGTITAGAKNIGSNSGGTNEYFNGTIDNVKMYNRALSAAEVAQNFNASRTRYGI